jgi:hypothetical protein
MLGILLKNKRKELKKTQKKSEEEKLILEVKVNARIREAIELSNSLREQVQRKTEDLRRKVRELEKLNALVKGREDKLILLEREAERLKTKLEIKEEEKPS